jgi:outer membrane protein TolC
MSYALRCAEYADWRSLQASGHRHAADVRVTPHHAASHDLRRDKLAEAVKANRQAVALANELYTRGLSDFLNVLESQRSLFASQIDLVQSEATVSADAVALYKALGGGREGDVRPP